MKNAIPDALDHELIREPLQYVSEYSFRLDRLSKRITIRVYLQPDGQFYFEQSHYIQTPRQATPYMTSIQWAETEEIAISRAVSTLVGFYQGALHQGLEPNDEWLVPNTTFFDPNADDKIR